MFSLTYWCWWSEWSRREYSDVELTLSARGKKTVDFRGLYWDTSPSCKIMMMMISIRKFQECLCLNLNPIRSTWQIPFWQAYLFFSPEVHGQYTPSYECHECQSLTTLLFFLMCGFNRHVQWTWPCFECSTKQRHRPQQGLQHNWLSKNIYLIVFHDKYFLIVGMHGLPVQSVSTKLRTSYRKA